MEYKEVSRILSNIECYIPFGIFRAEDANVFCAISRKTAQVLELSYQHHHDGIIRFIQTSIPCPKHIPSKDIGKECNKIYHRTEQRYRNDIFLDALMVPEIPSHPEIIAALISAKFSTYDASKYGYYVASLSNCGGCQIHFKVSLARRWNLVCDVSSMWSKHCLKKYEEPIQAYNVLQEFILDNRLTALAWNNSILYENRHILAVVNGVGLLAFVRIDSDVEPVIFEMQTDMLKVNILEWITFHNKKGKLHSYIVMADVLGNISLFAVTFDDARNISGVSELSKLWTEGDKVRANGIKWVYQSQTEQLIITCCKGSHVFFYLLNSAGAVLSHCIYYVGGLFITGIYKISSKEYLIGTLNGHLERLQLEINKKTMTVIATDVKNQINSSKYLLYGLVGSVNNAFLISALHIGQPYDHLKYRRTANLFIQQELSGKVLEKLERNKLNKLTFFHDYAELYRCLQMRHDLFLEYFSTIPDAITFTDEYLYKLKIRLIATSARSTYLRQRGYFGQADILLSEHEIIKKFLLAIRCCRSVKYISNVTTSLTDFQALSLKCQRKYLKGFLIVELTENYGRLRAEALPEIQLLLVETQFLDTGLQEECVYCGAHIEEDKLVCNDGHDLPRCCLSMAQLPPTNKWGCIECQTATFDDTKCLEEVLPNVSNEILCPFCDLPFSAAITGYDLE